MTQHATDQDAVVIDILLRNYRPQEPFTIKWTDIHTGGYCFKTSPEIMPTKKTSANNQQAPSIDTYLPVALEILNGHLMEVSLFKTELKKRSGISDRRLARFMEWVTAGGNPALQTREERGRGLYKKWIGKTDLF
jgi:hypothetical protein